MKKFIILNSYPFSYEKPNINYIFLYFFLYSCEKDKINNQQPNSVKTLKQQDPGSGGTGGSTGSVLLNAPLPISQLIEVPDDYAEEMFNMQIYRIARGFCNVAGNATLLSNTYASLVTTNDDASVAIESLIQSNAQYQSKIEEYSTQLQSLVFSKSKRNSARAAASEAPQTYDQTVSLMTYQNIAYKPVIYVPNAQSADFSLKPIIAIGTDFAWPTDEYEDYIPAWKVNSDNSLKEVVLNEQTAHNCSNPVIIITNEAANYENSNETSFNFQSNLPIQNTTSLYGSLKPYFTEFQIDHRYELDNRSDFYQVAYFLFSDGSYSSKYHDQLIQKIH